MKEITASEARRILENLIEQVAKTHRPIRIAGDCPSAVLVAEADWRSIQETLFLCSAPGMRESIVKGMGTPAHKCADRLDW